MLGKPPIWVDIGLRSVYVIMNSFVNAKTAVSHYAETAEIKNHVIGFMPKPSVCAENHAIVGVVRA